MIFLTKPLRSSLGRLNRAVSNQAPSVKVYLCNASSTCLPVISLRNAYLSAGSLHRIKEAQGSFTKASDKVPIVIKMAWLVLVVETIFYFAFIEPQLRKVEIFDVPRAVEKIECDMSACGLDS